MDINQAEALNLLQLMVETKTVNPPGDELLLAQKLARLAVAEGLEASVDEFLPGRANLHLILRGKEQRQRLLLLGHLDTVSPGERAWQHNPFACTLEDDRIYGRGVADMKGSLAAMLYALLLLRRQGVKPPQDVCFLATADEEMQSRGAEHFAASGGMEGVGALVVGEPSNGELIIAHKGEAWLKVCFYGKTAHGSTPEFGINALLHLSKFIETFRRQKISYPQDTVLGLPTCSVNTASAGVATNVVPDYAECTLDYRSLPGQTAEDMLEFLESILREAAAGEKDYRYTVEMLYKAMPAVACPKGHRLLDTFDAAAGRKLQRRGVSYFTEASGLVPHADFPFVIYGPGDDKLAHQPDEYLSLAKYFESISVYYNFLRDYAVND